MLAAKQNTELLFFIEFMKRANRSDIRYIEIVEPILLDVSDFLNKRKTIYQLDRHSLEIKIILIECKFCKWITKDNLQLNEVSKFLNELPDKYYFK